MYLRLRGGTTIEPGSEVAVEAGEGGAASSQRKETTALLQDNVRHRELIRRSQRAASRDGSGDGVTRTGAEPRPQYSGKSAFFVPRKRPQRWEFSAEETPRLGRESGERWVSRCGLCCCVVFVFSYEVSLCPCGDFYPLALSCKRRVKVQLAAREAVFSRCLEFGLRLGFLPCGAS